MFSLPEYFGFVGYIQRMISTGSISNCSKTLGNPKAEEDEPHAIENPFKREDPKCILCRFNITADFKNPRMLSQFQSRYTGRIYSRNITGLCKNKQKEVERAIKKSQSCAFMPIYFKAPEFYEDPKLYDPENPIRPHPY